MKAVKFESSSSITSVLIKEEFQTQTGTEGGQHEDTGRRPSTSQGEGLRRDPVLLLP